MSEPNSETLVRALQQSLGAELVQTHISWVLLAGGEAWKIKKPVRLGFLDFSTLAQRRRLCEEELRLNRRLVPSLYLDVVAITGTPQQPRLGGAGQPIEYALHMRRFAADALLARRLEDGRLLPEQIDALAQRIAAFHRAAAPADAASAYGSPQQVADAMEAVLAGLAAQGAGDALGPLRDWARAQARQLGSTWAERKAQGLVREGHGDLHLENTLVLDGEVTAFDCIEFDPALRWIDVQADIAFMVMDLLAHARADLAYRFLDTYLAAGGDYAGLAVLRYYLVYRACVRALVTRLRPGGARAGGPDYLALARALSVPAQNFLLITHGVSGSGKSLAAARLLERCAGVRLRSDVERKRLFGLGALEASAAAIPGGIYGEQATQRTYERLAELASVVLAAGWPVIVDAAFLRERERGTFKRLAEQLQVPFAILHCQAPEALLLQRVQARHARGDDASEADADVLRRQLSFQQPLRADELACAIVLDTRAPEAAARLGPADILGKAWREPAHRAQSRLTAPAPPT